MRLLSVLLLATASGGAFGQSLGRFGYGPVKQAGGFELDANGFKANHPLADRFDYFSPSSVWKVQQVDLTEQVIGRNVGALSPRKVRVIQTALGFEVYVTAGLGLRIKSTAAPYLTWDQGSVGAQIETPKEPWVAVSFRDKQPPIILGFLNGGGSATVAGSPGAWEIRTNWDYEGWIRIGLPLGPVGLATTDAQGLGALAKAAITEAKLWTSPAPKFLGVSATDVGQTRTVTVSFDRTGAVLPPYWTLAQRAKFPLQFASPVRPIAILDLDGPVVVAESSVVRLTIPNPRLPEGRGIALDWYPGDVQNIVSEALLLGTGAWQLQRDTHRATFESFAPLAPSHVVPWTGKAAPFLADGTGVANASKAALLAYAGEREGATMHDRSLLTALSGRFDWWTGGFLAPAVEQADALAHLSLASAFLEGSSRVTTFAEMAIAGQVGLAEWRKQRGLPLPEAAPAPFASLRAALNGYAGRSDNWAEILRSRWRIRKGMATLGVMGDKFWIKVDGRKGNGETYYADLLLPAGVKLRVMDNVATWSDRGQADGWSELQYRRLRPGPAVFELQFNEGLVPIPAGAPFPRSER